MKKSQFLLPLVAVLGLVGCSSETSPKGDGSDESQIAASVDAAASNAGINNNGWIAADITPTSMPSSMNQTVATPSYGRVTASATPTPAPATQAVVAQPAPVASSAAPTPSVAAPQSVSAQPNYPAPAPSEKVGSCEVVRDAAGTPVYSQMIKGCYTGNYYTVGSKDTLFLISYLTGQTPAQIAALNGIDATTKLTVGKSIRVR